jgi:hypothetical protein
MRKIPKKKDREMCMKHDHEDQTYNYVELGICFELLDVYDSFYMVKFDQGHNFKHLSRNFYFHFNI